MIDSHYLGCQTLELSSILHDLPTARTPILTRPAVAQLIADNAHDHAAVVALIDETVSRLVDVDSVPLIAVSGGDDKTKVQYINATVLSHRVAGGTARGVVARA